MSLISYVQYLLLKAKCPERADYLSEGFGIAARARRARKFWANHLAFSKEFQSRHLGAGETTLILGAGRLFDVDCDFLAKHFKRIELLDADPGVVPHWEKKIRNFPGNTFGIHITELTGKIDDWTYRLRHAGRSAALATLTEFSNEKLKPAVLSKVDAIVSLNLLSQIPIYWRDRALDILGDDAHEPEIAAALDRSLATLQRQHLLTLERSGAKTVIIISDLEFFYYKRDRCDWQAEPALFFKESLSLPGYSLKSSDSWLWHIAPQGIEFADYGVIHKVQALAFKR